MVCSGEERTPVLQRPLREGANQNTRPAGVHHVLPGLQHRQGPLLQVGPKLPEPLMHIGSIRDRVPTAQGKQGKWQNKKSCQGKHREFGNLAKTQGIWFAQIVNSLIL